MRYKDTRQGVILKRPIFLPKEETEEEAATVGDIAAS